nr:tyrosine-type recombinase/integrase [Jiangella asiatica]
MRSKPAVRVRWRPLGGRGCGRGATPRAVGGPVLAEPAPRHRLLGALLRRRRTPTTSRPPGTDHHEWKRLLKAAGVRDGRLHDARHTASTVLLILGVPERTVMSIMGWSSTAMAARYQHVTDPMRRAVADQVDGLLWADQDDDEKPA